MNNKQHLLGITFLFAAFMLSAMVACNSSNNQLIGSWVEPIPGQEDNVQGFKLEADGNASSINMSTLKYESWSSNGKQLLLTGKSIGNGVTIDFTDTLLIQKVTADSLLLNRGQGQWSYVRQQ